MYSGSRSCLLIVLIIYSVNSYKIACQHDHAGYSLSCRFSHIEDNKTLTNDLPKDFANYTKFITELAFEMSNLTTIPSDTFNLFPNLETLVSHADIQMVTRKTFHNARRLVMLNFGFNNRLTRLETRLFKYASTLEYIDMGDNEIAAVEDEAFHGLSHLKTLYLEENSIEILTNATFHGAQNLQFLSLSRNQIFEIGNGTFARMSKLKNLLLNGNQIDSLANLFDGLDSIERLDLSINLIAVIEDGVFDKLKNLKVLELGFNRLTTLPESIFDGLPNLSTLFLASNGLQNIDYLNSTRLKMLDLSYNPLTTLESNAFSDVLNLKSLELRGCNLDELADDQFTELIHLELLDLSENNLSSMELTVFDPLDNLQILKLEATQMTDVANFTEMKNLMPAISFINLSHNNIDCDTVYEIIEYFKQNNIHYDFGEEIEEWCEIEPFSKYIQVYELSHAEFIETSTQADKSDDVHDQNNLNL